LFAAKSTSKKCQWFSGKIQRCHRWAPGSFPAGAAIFFSSYLTLWASTSSHHGTKLFWTKLSRDNRTHYPVYIIRIVTHSSNLQNASIKIHTMLLYRMSPFLLDYTKQANKRPSPDMLFQNIRMSVFLHLQTQLAPYFISISSIMIILDHLLLSIQSKYKTSHVLMSCQIIIFESILIMTKASL